MRIVEEQYKTNVMPFTLRPLEERDIPQSAEVERDAFPTLVPSTSFRRELKTRRARYLVAWRRDDVAEPESHTPDLPDPSLADNGRPLIGQLLRNARSLWSKPLAWEPGQHFLVGFVGIWYMIDEAHIVSVAVRRKYRGHGIGELLLIGAIEQAMARGARVVTLEVRASNDIAKNLYLKYGFKERGVRKGYYTNDREDAIIMTTDPIIIPPYPERFRKLVQAHEERWGVAERVLT